VILLSSRRDEMSFADRIVQHNIIAMAIVSEVLSKYGITIIPDGHEINKDLKIGLMGCNDPLSRLIRHRPDSFNKNNKKPSRNFLAEIKSAATEYPNFSIEVEAHYYHRKYMALHQEMLSVMFFVEPEVKRCKACWTQDVPTPYYIYLPKRFDYLIKKQTIESMYPHAKIIDKEHKGGSGTPYFLIKKDSSYLKDIDIFIQQEISIKQTTLDITGVQLSNGQKTLF
jgi:hypothetical protein